MVTAERLTPDRILRRLEWQVIRRLDGRLQGNYRTLLPGPGTDFRDIRDYESGDDVRHIDWNVTARMDALFVRQYAEDRELTAWLLLDRSPSMGFGPVDRTKEVVLCELAATIGQLLVRGGNRVGAILYDNGIEATIPPRQGRDQVLTLIRDLLRPVQQHGRVTDLRPLLDTASGMLRRRSLVVLISDFITEPGWERSLLRLTERHEVIAIRLLDPREFELPDAGVLVVEDAETGEQLVVDSSDPEFRRRLRAAGDQRELELREAARRAGVDLHVISTEDDLVKAFVRMVEFAPASEALMSFRSPWMLGALVLIPAIVVAYVWSRRRRAERAHALASQGLVMTTAAAGPGRRHHLSFALFVAALTVLVVALARPSMSVRTPRREATVILAVDVSNSMAATDVKPTRFEAAKTAAKAFVAKQPSEVRIGVVAFGVGAVTVQQPTLVHSDVVKAVDRLSLGGGTSVGQGLLTSLDVIAGKQVTIDEKALASDAGRVDIGYFGSSTIVLFSDGENLSDPDPVSVADVASVAGVHVQSIGVGTEAGSVVDVDGFSVATALDPDLLTKVASATGGSYHQAADAAGLAAVSRTIDLHFKVVSQHTEVTGLFSAVGALLLVAAALLSILWFGRVV